MSCSLPYLGIDVDDKAYHFCVFDPIKREESFETLTHHSIQS